MPIDFEVTMNEYLPLRDVVFNTLRRAILRGELKPGERLMEIQLANKLGVSRTPIREAIRKLELEGLVLMIPRKGAEVAEITEKNLRDVLEVRCALEELAVQLACDRINQEEIHELHAAAARFEQMFDSDDITSIAQADEAFHDVIFQATDNERLIQLLNNLREQMYRYRIEYLKKKEEYELYQKLLLRSGGKKPAGLAPENPEPVKQMNLNISGYTSLARMIEQLETNSHYASCLFETEMEAVTNTLFQEYGNYGYLLNQAAHHERIGNSTKTNGSLLASYPLLSMLLTGTPEMFRRLVPSAESGLFSRLMVYKIAGHGEYRPLTSEDDTPAAAHYFDSLAERVLDIGVHLDKHPTWVHFSDTQRKRLNRYFKQEYNNVRVFGHEDVASAVLRYRLAIFRIGMVLTAIRKGETLSEEKEWVIRDDDFEVAFHIGTICLQHTYVVSTSLKKSKKELRYKMPFTSQKIFAEMPLKFKRAEIRDAGHVLLLSKSSVDRLLTSAEKNGLIVSLGAGYFHKTTIGREIAVPIIP